MTIADNHVVSIHYKLTGDAGEIIDSSEGKDPLTYLHGTKNIIPGLEQALAGKTVGDKLQVTVQPENGYGAINPDLIQTVPLSAFEGMDNIQPGMQFEAKGPKDQKQLITVQEVRKDGVIIDGNHPMAGKVLHFDVSIESIREASPEERSHGHAH